MNRPILIVISLFLSLVLGMLLISPKYQDLKASQLKIEEKNIEIQQLEEYFSHLENISQELKKYTEVLSKIDSALPKEPSFSSLFNFFQKVSSESGLVLKEIGFPATSLLEEKSYIKKHSLLLSLSGSYSSFKNFLLILEKSARFIEVESISLSSPLEKGGPFIFNLKVKVHSY